jgi:hypothetical protein
MTENIDIFLVNPISFETQTYASDDDKLIASTIIDESFSPGVDYVEYTVFNLNQEPVAYLPILNDYKIIDNKLNIEPGNNIKSLGFTDGQYYSLYNFLTNKLGSSPDNTYYISEISSDRTELRLDSLNINNETIITSTSDLINELNTSEYYLDFYLNFGLNKLIIANNVLLDTSDSNNPTVLIKLYEPLPAEFDVKSELWIVDKIAESVAYQINLQTIFQYVDNNVKLKGPNFNLGLNDKTNNSTDYVNFASSTTSSYQLGTGSFYSQINNLLSQKGININIDYSSYSNFVHFSSAETRLENFYYKMSLLETYQKSARSGSNTTNTFTSGSTAYYNGLINDLISNFDGYEYYLYYNSSSTTWPKTNSTPPYINASVANVSTWFNNQLTTAITYDQQNKDALVYTIPQYLYDDPTNSQFELFVEMIGQHFDTIYNYTKDITNKYNADNRLDYGVSKDLIADILRDFGLKIYQNNFSTQNLYSAFLGITPSGSLFNIPGITTTLPATSGLEYITTFVTASSTSSLVPLDDANKEIYKRLYHNLPYLLKKKGTTAGLRTLINTYGIPDTILRINEFGGKDKNNTQDWDNWQDQFNYAFNATGSGYVSASWDDFNNPTGDPPSTVLFRFKTNESIPTYYSQSLLLFSGSGGILSNYRLVLEYSGSGLTSASYSGSIPSSSYQNATLKWISGSTSASVIQPFYNGDWWSVMLKADGSKQWIYSKQKGSYQGDNYIKYQGSASFNNVGNLLNNTVASSSYLGGLGPLELSNKLYYPLNGQFQEFRYYSTPLSENVFNDFVLNPYSIEGNNITGSQSSHESLLFRAPLGTDLKTYPYTLISSSQLLIKNPQGVLDLYTSSPYAWDSNTYILSIPRTPIITISPFITWSREIEEIIQFDNGSGTTKSSFNNYYAVDATYTIQFGAYIEPTGDPCILEVFIAERDDYNSIRGEINTVTITGVDSNNPQIITIVGSIPSSSLITTYTPLSLYFKISNADAQAGTLFLSVNEAGVGVNSPGLSFDFNQYKPLILQSIHPAVTGSNITSSFSSSAGKNSNYELRGVFTYATNSEYIYQDQPNAGIKIPISDKVKIGSQILPTGDTLSPYISIQQDLPISSSYTKDVNYVEVGFSPQDEINDDIQEQFGFFNYGEYIGDPRFQSSSATSYPELNKFRDYYFQKYYKNNNIFDYVRLIKYFDNSLFKMIQDFVPARTDLATGVIIKQHILERNRYRSPQVDWEDNQYTGSVTSLSSGYTTGSKIYTFTGSTGGTVPYLLSTTSSGYYPPFINISQSWSEVVQTPSGSLVKIHNNLEEFYNGEFEGTTIVATTQSLIDGDCRQFLDVDTTEVQYKPILYKFNGSAPVNQSTFLGSTVTPSAGEILLYYISEQVEQGSPDGQQSQRPNQSQNTQ